MKVTMTETLCAEGMEMLAGCETFVAHDAHPHNYFDQLRDSDAFIVRVADKGAVDASTKYAMSTLGFVDKRVIRPSEPITAEEMARIDAFIDKMREYM